MGLSVRTVMLAVLGLQLGIGGLLVLGDMRNSSFALPKFSPPAPRLSAPIEPGDQRRLFEVQDNRPAVRPARDPGVLPDRLTLSHVADGEWRLEGAIAEGDADRIIALLDKADPKVEALILQSPGGSVKDALKLGRSIREKALSIRMLSGEYCFSACPYLLAGGETRDISEDASVGVHQHYFGQNTILPAFLAVETIQNGQGQVMAYLEEMGIDLAVMKHALTTPKDEIYVLLPDQLIEYGFVTPKS